MKKVKNSFKDEVIKIDDIIVKITDNKEYLFAVKRHFNGYAIWVDLNNDRVPKYAGNQYKKLVKITREPNMHGVLVPHRTLNDKLQVIMSKDAIAKIEELTNLVNDDPVQAVTVAQIEKWQNALTAIDCTDEAIKAQAKKALVSADPIASATSKVVGLVKNFLDNLGNSGDVNKNLSIGETARQSQNNQTPAVQAKVEGLVPANGATDENTNSNEPDNSNQPTPSEPEGM